MAFISYNKTKHDDGTTETTFQVDPVALIIIFVIIMIGAIAIFTN